MSSPLSTVTIDDLASELRRILDSGFAAPEVERAHNMLDSYDVQQAEASKPASHVNDERYLDGLLHCLDCAYDNPGSDDPRCNMCTCGSLWEQAEPSKPALSEVEQQAILLCAAWDRLCIPDSVASFGPLEVRTFVSELLRLREALRKRGAL